MLEVPVGVRVVQGTVLGKALHMVGALHLVQHGVAAVVGPGYQLAMAVKVQSPCVAASLAEKFKRATRRMVPPDSLLKLDSTNLPGHGAALGAVQPPIRSPDKAVGVGMGILHAKPGQQHLRIPIGNVVAIFVGVEQKVGRLHHEDTAPTQRQSRGKVQARNEIPRLAIATVGVRILQDGDPVGTLGPLGRRFGNLVPNRAEILVLGYGLEAGGIRVLKILDNPHPPAAVEGDAERLANERFGRDQPGLETRFGHHARQGLFGRITLRNRGGGHQQPARDH